MKILFATDGSRYSEEAAWFLSHLPHGEKMELIVLSVIEKPAVQFMRRSDEWVAQCVENEKRLANASYANIVEMFEGANAELRHMVREGHPGETIVHHARGLDVDLVVVGGRGHSQIDRILIGSTSDFVASHSHCSALVVRPTGLRLRDDGSLRVAVGYDDTGPAQAAIEELCEFNWGEHSDVRVVPVAVCSNSLSPGEAAAETKQAKAGAIRAAQRAADQLRQVAPAVKPDVIEHGHVGEGLVTYAEQHGCDVLVVGDSDRSTLGKIFLGSVSTYVLRHASCSVWITRNRMIKGIKKASDRKAESTAK